MKKLLAILFAAVLLLSCAACRSSDGIYPYGQNTLPAIETNPSTEPTQETLPQETFGPQPGGGVFNLNNITRITFFSYYGGGTGSDVPAEHMQEIIDWLATFTLGDQAPEILPPGTNMNYIEIEYSYGAVFRTGMNTVDYAGTIYYIRGGEAPGCFSEIVRGSTLP
jgi:hypothetical protein